MSSKRYLITPGPTPIPPEVAAAAATPMQHHRSPEFRALLLETLDRLKQVFATENDLVLFTGSGTAAMESSVANLLSPGDRVVVASAGNFGQRWVKLVRAYGIEPVLVEQPWGERLDAARIAGAASEAETAAVFVTHSETSTGVVHDVEAIAAAVAPTGAILVVDAVSSLGGVELATDAWGVDVVVSGSQKALMSPPGLAFASVSERAWARAGRSTLPRYYLDWRLAADSQVKGDTAFTPAVSIVVALRTALDLILARGPASVWEHNRLLARATRAGVKGLGLELFSPDDDSAAMVTALLMPDGIDGQECYTVLRDRHGIVLAGGHGPLRGRIMRIGHMGYMNEFDIVTALAGLEMALGELGHTPPVPGGGVAAATALFAAQPVPVDG
ncbi:MAG TPA: alanine--glyoxylate aminotransferase family protein [Gaiellales bacterium]|nr:alanine--glyoxylate aminotransferase family protein [Gaiellales bacterium]